METTINSFSFGLLTWQILTVLILIIMIYYLLKLYKKLMSFLDKNS